MENKETADTLSLRITEIMNSEISVNERLSSSLAILCENFQYERGFIYQTNGFDVYVLKETFGEEIEVMPRKIKKESLPLNIINFLQKSSFYLNNGESMTEDEKALSELVGVNSYVFLTCRDNNGTLIGIIGLADKKGNPLRRQIEIERIRILLSMLSKEVVIREYEYREERATKTLESIMDNMGIDIYVNEFNTHEMLYANKSMASPYGGIDHFRGKKCWQALYKDKDGECDFCPQKKLLDHEGKPTKVYSWDYMRPFDQSWFRVFSAAFRWIDGRMAHVVTSVDITENKTNEAIIKQMAEHDPLTGLPNRRRLIQDFEDTQKAGTIREAYVMFMDLDGFKLVNDNFGHNCGDELLIQIARFFQSIPDLEERTYRLSGDEFVIVLPNADHDQIIALSKIITDRFNQVWKLKNGDVSCKVSIGIAHYPSDASTPEELMHIADMTMYSVKRAGKQGVRFANKTYNLI